MIYDTRMCPANTLETSSGPEWNAVWLPRDIRGCGSYGTHKLPGRFMWPKHYCSFELSIISPSEITLLRWHGHMRFTNWIHVLILLPRDFKNPYMQLKGSVRCISGNYVRPYRFDDLVCLFKDLCQLDCVCLHNEQPCAIAYSCNGCPDVKELCENIFTVLTSVWMPYNIKCSLWGLIIYMFVFLVYTMTTLIEGICFSIVYVWHTCMNIHWIYIQCTRSTLLSFYLDLPKLSKLIILFLRYMYMLLPHS